jgi:hypothetical protein
MQPLFFRQALIAAFLRDDAQGRAKRRAVALCLDENSDDLLDRIKTRPDAQIFKS